MPTTIITETIAVTDDGAICADCDGGVDAPSRHHRPEPKPCAVCWLTHPEGACDRD